MTEAIFQIQGSASEPYEIQFLKNNESLRIICSCPAGNMHQFCKHISLILDESTQIKAVTGDYAASDARQWLIGSKLESALNVLKAAEAKYAQAKSILSQAKRNTSAAMHG